MWSSSQSGGSLVDVAGLSVGHSHRMGEGWLTGTTVVLAPPGGFVAAVDVRGGGPATRETYALDPGGLVPRIEAIVLTGGSAYGLDAASGVLRWLEERQRGFPVGPAPHEVVPVVPAAAIFDLGRGGDFMARPDASFGGAAADSASSSSVPMGSVGAGAGAVAGGLRGGVGTASTTLPGGVVVAALVVVNAAGSTLEEDTGALLGARSGLPGEFPAAPTAAEHAAAREVLAAHAAGGAGAPLRPPPPLNTTIGVVGTTAALTRVEAQRLAMTAHDGLARSIRPVHTLFDGDTLFAMATGKHPLPDGPDLPAVLGRAQMLAAVQAGGADVVARAVAHAVLAASPAPGLHSYAELYPSVAR